MSLRMLSTFPLKVLKGTLKEITGVVSTAMFLLKETPCVGLKFLLKKF